MFNSIYVLTTAKTPDNVGQVLENLLVDNNVDTAKSVNCKHKNQNQSTYNLDAKIKKCTHFQLSEGKISGNCANFNFH